MTAAQLRRLYIVMGALLLIAGVVVVGVGFVRLLADLLWLALSLDGDSGVQ